MGFTQARPDCVLYTNICQANKFDKSHSLESHCSQKESKERRQCSGECTNHVFSATWQGIMLGQTWFRIGL